jgi:hypothetical protein
MTCHLSGELVDRPNHVHRAGMAQPTFDNSSRSEIANKTLSTRRFCESDQNGPLSNN